MKPGDPPIPFGKYRLVRRLGVGGMAEAFLAKTEGPGGFEKTLVVKRMLPHIAADERYVAMFHREAKIAALLTHTNVVQIFELGDIDGAPFIAMEYVDGAALHRLARSSWRRGRSLPLEAACCAMADIALGLSAAHDLCDPEGRPLGVVHRDVSPDNMMMNKEGVTKLLDFGVAKLSDAERTATGAVKGKIPFLAPEYIQQGRVDRRSDLYALGVTFYWLVTGKRPFQATGDHALMEQILKEPPAPPRHLNPHVPDLVDKLILALLAKEPDARPQSGTVVHDMLAEALATRRAVVVPFVRAALEAGVGADSDVSGPSVIAATPQTDTLRSWPLPPPTALVGDTNDLGFVDAAPTTIQAPADTSILDDTFEVPFAAVPATVLESGGGFAVATTTVHEAGPDGTPASRRRGVAAMVAAALVMSAVGMVALVLAGDDQAGQPKPAPPAASPPPPAAAEPPAPPPTTTPATTARRTPEPTPGPAPSATMAAPTPSKAPAPKPAPAPEQPLPPRGVEISARAPAGVQWLVVGRNVGAGVDTFTVPPGTTSVLAFDKRRGGRSSVPIVDGVADYGTLPRGKINPRANPYADVFLGSEALGTTPFAPVDVVVGSYTLRFVFEGKEQRRSVDVDAGATAKVSVDFER